MLQKTEVIATARDPNMTPLMNVAPPMSVAPPMHNHLAPPPPSFVFILMDDTGFNDIGYQQTNRTVPIRTPRIDALASEGVKLSNYYVQPICTPTRAALMTGRYPFRYGVTGYTIDARAPWGIPTNETFLPQFFKDAGYTTAVYGKWHLGFFKSAVLPTSRGFDFQSGLYNAQGDHYEHTIDGGYDWHVDEKTQRSFRGQYSGNLVRDDAVAFLRNASHYPTTPFFLYVAFQEAHSPYQVDPKYRHLYPELDGQPQAQNLAGMVTHTDEMVGDIYDSLTETTWLNNTILVFSADNGGPGGQDGRSPRPSRFDPSHIERNGPFRGQKHEIYEGGVRVAGFVHSHLLQRKVIGTTHHAMMHVTDWLPTLVTASGVASLSSRPHLDLDGIDQWECLNGDESKCKRNEAVLNINTVCDDGTGPRGYSTECPAPKAGIRMGELKLLAECYDQSSQTFTGKLLLYNLSADASEERDLSALLPSEVHRLGSRLLTYAKEAAEIPPLGDKPPWQGDGYYCAECKVGKPVGKGKQASWEPWCEGASGVAC